jgi:L-ascorbate metabolism protein UlaG (beta-lactamase superfamily)
MPRPDALYLKPNVVAEPLFNQWYAWGMLIPPQTAAMFTAFHHAPTMRSYLAAPQAHAAAVKNPEMVGGPYVDHGGGRTDEIAALLARTERDLAGPIEFARGVKELVALLKREAKGYSLEPLYAKLPEALKGRVELVYDLQHRPSFRFLESLLYRTDVYDPRRQSLSLSLVDDDYRPFVFSTPRLPDDRHLWLNLPFADPRVDELFAMRGAPAPFEQIRDRLGVGPDDVDRFRRFFTAEAPPPPRRFEGPGVRVRYFGHACVLLETADVSVLVDPCVSYDYPNGLARFTYADLPPVIDYVLITHCHQDHLLLEHLLQLRHRVRHVVVGPQGTGALQDPSVKLLLRQVGFKSVIELGELDEIELPGGSIVGLPFWGEHGDLDIRCKIAHLVTLAGRRFLCAADTNNIEDRLYQQIRELVGEVDVLFLGMDAAGAPFSWIYGALFLEPLERKMDHSRRLRCSNNERCVGLVDRFNCKEAYVYALGLEPWLTYFMGSNYQADSPPIVESNLFVENCRRRGLRSERLYCKKELVYPPA